MEESINQRIRLTAYKVPINVLIGGNFFRDEDGLHPSYIEFGDREVSRVNVMAVVVSIEKRENITSLVIDDGTAKISVRSFEQNTISQDIQIGDIINIIGRLREYNADRYLVPEIVKKISQKWMIVRKKEIENFVLSSKKDVEIEEIEANGNQSHISKSEQIIQFIKQQDNGDGVDIDKIVTNLKIPDCEEIIETLLKEGDIFENFPGKLKLLE